jgi:hypothetical protein
MTTQADTDAGASMPRSKAEGLLVGNERLVGDVVLAALFAATSYGALRYPPLARIFPLSVGILATVLSLINLAIDVGRRRSAGTRRTPLIRSIESEAERTAEVEAVDPESSTAATLGVAKAWGWILGYTLAIWLAGFEAATALFIFAVLRFEARRSYLFAATGAVIAVLSVAVFSWFFDVPFPGPLWWPF